MQEAKFQLFITLNKTKLCPPPLPSKNKNKNAVIINNTNI